MSCFLHIDMYLLSLSRYMTKTPLRIYARFGLTSLCLVIEV